VYAGHYTPQPQSGCSLQGASGTRLRRLSLSGSPKRGEIIFSKFNFAKQKKFCKLKNKKLF